MKNFGPFLSNLRSSAGLSLEELSILVDSSRSSLSRLENNHVPQPFKGAVRKLVITLAEILCTSKSEMKRYLELAGTDQALLSEAEQIQVGFAPAIPSGTPEETISLERAERIYQQLLTQLEAKKTVLGDTHPSPNLRLKIQEYANILAEIHKRLDVLYNQRKSNISQQSASFSPASISRITVHEPSEELFARGSEVTSASASYQESGIILPAFDLGVSDKLDSAESIINLAWETWFASRPTAVTRSVNRLLPSLEKIAHAPYPPGQTLRAKELVVRAHGLLGSVCLDTVQNDTALFHYMQAHLFAEEIHNNDLATTYLCLVGEVLRQQHDQSEALRYMENARDAASHTSKTTRGYILQLLAYAYGDTGQEIAFERTIAEATDLLAFSGEGRDVSQKEFIPFEIYEIRGKIYRDLGKPLNAIPYLELAEKSLTTADSVTPRWHALLEISRAQAYCDAGDLATGIELACRGFNMAYQCHSPLQMNRVRKLLKKLESGTFQNNPKVQDLKNLLFDVYMRVDTKDAAKSAPPIVF